MDNTITSLLEEDDTQTISMDLEEGTTRIIFVVGNTDGSYEIVLNDSTNLSIDKPFGGLDSE